MRTDRQPESQARQYFTHALQNTWKSIILRIHKPLRCKQTHAQIRCGRQSSATSAYGIRWAWLRSGHAYTGAEAWEVVAVCHRWQVCAPQPLWKLIVGVCACVICVIVRVCMYIYIHTHREKKRLICAKVLDNSNIWIFNVCGCGYPRNISASQLAFFSRESAPNYLMEPYGVDACSKTRSIGTHMQWNYVCKHVAVCIHFLTCIHAYIHICIHTCRGNATRVLLESGADANAVSEYTHTALHYAARKGWTPVCMNVFAYVYVCSCVCTHMHACVSSAYAHVHILGVMRKRVTRFAFKIYIRNCSCKRTFWVTHTNSIHTQVYIHTYTDIHTYIHTYIHTDDTYIHTGNLCVAWLWSRRTCDEWGGPDSPALCRVLQPYSCCMDAAAVIDWFRLQSCLLCR